MTECRDPIEIRPLQAEDYAAAMAIWQGCDGICLRQENASEASFRRFVARNSDLCLGAWKGESLVGAMLVGHDSRRAYLYHLAIAESYRRQRIGHRLVDAALKALKRIGITKAHLFVEADNNTGMSFWRAVGAEQRLDLELFSLTIPPS